MKDILIGIALFIVATLIVSSIDARPNEVKPEQQSENEHSLGEQVPEYADIILSDKGELDISMISPQTG